MGDLVRFECDWVGVVECGWVGGFFFGGGGSVWVAFGVDVF